MISSARCGLAVEAQQHRARRLARRVDHAALHRRVQIGRRPEWFWPALLRASGAPTGPLYAGNPHVRWEEGVPVRTPCEDTQAPSTERGGNSYCLATAQPDRVLLYIPYHTAASFCSLDVSEGSQFIF